MDELKLKLSTKFMRGIVAKLISKFVYKKTGCKIDIQINSIDITNEQGKMKIHMDVDGAMENIEFIKALKACGLED